MFPRTLLLALGALPFTGNAVPIRPVVVGSECPNAIAHEPLLVYEVTGGTLVGPVDLHLTVFVDGAVSLSDATYGRTGKAAIGFVGPENVSTLALDLLDLGAFQLCDATGTVTDVPLHTLAMMSPGTDSKGHTFSWWLPTGSPGAVQLRLEQFIADAFPGF
jgi:hypothetical protein